jgi:hypothetical protein
VDEDPKAHAQMEPNPSNGEAVAQESLPSNNVLPSEGTRSEGNGNGDSAGVSPKKPKFFDRVRGEVKVITGKLGGDESRVEEGRRMMGRRFSG